MDLHDLIEQKAYEIYLQDGKMEGHDLDNWLEAERIVNNQDSYAEDYWDNMIEGHPV